MSTDDPNNILEQIRQRQACIRQQLEQLSAALSGMHNQETLLIQQLREAISELRDACTSLVSVVSGKDK